MIVADVPVAWTVVPVLAVAATLIGLPCVEPDNRTFVNVGIYFLLNQIPGKIFEYLNR